MSSASIVLTNRRGEIGRLCPFVEQFGHHHHLATDEILDINLVLDEVIINIISHGYSDDDEHRIHVNLEIERELVTIRVEDDGRPFNLLDAPPPNLDLPIEERPIGGMGIHIVRSMTETIEHRRENGRNVLTLKKKVSA